MRDSVPSARYSPVCNVLRLWKTSLIPIFGSTVAIATSCLWSPPTGRLTFCISPMERHQLPSQFFVLLLLAFAMLTSPMERHQGHPYIESTTRYNRR